MNGPLLFTKRLILRPPLPEDFDSFAAFQAEEETMRHIGGVQPRSTAWRNFCGMAGEWAMRGFGLFSVIERKSGRWIGRIGPHYPDGWPGHEVGWAIDASSAGKGLAFEAAVAAMDYAVEVLGWDEIIHCIAPANTRSIALANRLGSRLLGPTQLPPPVAPGLPMDNWGQTAAEWRTRRTTLS